MQMTWVVSFVNCFFENTMTQCTGLIHQWSPKKTITKPQYTVHLVS